MKATLKKHFGYDDFRPLQEEIIQAVLDGKDAFVLMPTGGGKSLCFQLPSLMLDGLTLVVSPLIALMKDQVDSLTANGIQAAYLNSSLTKTERQEVEERAINGELDLLYVAPERVGSYGFSAFLEKLTVGLVAIDEAHCISEWGHDFRPDYRNLRNLRMRLPSVPMMALTATATQRVRQDILRELVMPQAKVFVSSFNRPNLTYHVRPKLEMFPQLLELLNQHKDASTIIYCFSRKDTESLALQLTHKGHKALAYHAGLPAQDRKRVQERFIRDEVPIIVATIAFGMGIDKPDVRLVVHTDLPKTIEGYYQETGRAGRDGLPSECVLFYSFGDKRKQDFFIEQIGDADEQALARKKLHDVIVYCQSPFCRRLILLTYFDEVWEEPHCESCDNCLRVGSEREDATIVSQKILSAVLKTQERFGTAYVCDVLVGSRQKRIRDNRHESLSVHGLLSKMPKPLIREYIQLLELEGYLEQEMSAYPVLRVSTKGRRALKDRAAIELPVPQTPAKSMRSKVLDGVDEKDAGLFESLRALRKKLASEQGVPPFVIFGDRTLHEMARVRPRTDEAFLELFGVGQSKLEKYGPAFMNCIEASVVQ
jgi:ATP-dependent DNA helicase RecQ